MSGAAQYQRGQVLRVQVQGHRDPVDMVCIERPGMFCGGGLMLMIDRCDGELDGALEALNLYGKTRAAAAVKSTAAPATIEANSQHWAGMDGATAWHLIDRHADGWNDVAKMMHEWLDANIASHPQGPHMNEETQKLTRPGF